MKNKMIALLALAAVGSTCLFCIRPGKPKAANQLEVVKMSDEQLVKEWQFANSARYEIGCELDHRRIHANRRTPEGTKAEGHVDVYLRGCWYGLEHWHNTNSDPKWRD